MNKLKLTILFLFMSLAASAQRLAVESLKLRPNDLSARNVKNQRHDLNGKPCALLKVMVLDNITKCSSGNIGDIVTEGPVKLIYITSATPSIELSFQYHYPITINFADYGYKHLEGNSTYELNLVDAQQMMMGNGNAAQQTATAPHVDNNQNSNNNQHSNSDAAVNLEKSKKLKKSGDKAYNAKKYKKALELYIQAADLGNPEAQGDIGYMYEKGVGVNTDYAMALKWYLKAAEQGNSVGLFNVGSLYYFGRGVQKDYGEAAKWWLKAAEQGMARAQYCLVDLYMYGKGVAEDKKVAFEWCLKAAEQGLAIAQCRVAGFYQGGTGGEQNDEKAFKWYYKAAEQNYPPGMEMLGELYKDGKGVAMNKQEAVKWFLKAADLDDDDMTMWYLGQSYEKGEGVEKNIDQAVCWYKKGAAKNNYSCKQALKRLGY